MMADSRLCELPLQLVFVTLFLSATITLSFLELAEEDCFGHAYVLDPSLRRGQPSAAAPEARRTDLMPGRLPFLGTPSFDT